MIHTLPYVKTRSLYTALRRRASGTLEYPFRALRAWGLLPHCGGGGAPLTHANHAIGGAWKQFQTPVGPYDPGDVVTRSHLRTYGVSIHRVGNGTWSSK
jgi:hypothetical protein